MKKPTPKTLYWLCKVLSFIVSVGLPVWVVINKFPLWVATHGVTRSVGAGGIIIAIIVAVALRDQVFGYMKQRFKIGHAPKITGWVVGLIIVYSLMFIVKFLYDISQVLWMGFIGSIVGTLLTLSGEIFFNENEVKGDTK